MLRGVDLLAENEGGVLMMVVQARAMDWGGSRERRWEGEGVYCQPFEWAGKGFGELNFERGWIEEGTGGCDNGVWSGGPMRSNLANQGRANERCTAGSERRGCDGLSSNCIRTSYGLPLRNLPLYRHLTPTLHKSALLYVLYSDLLSPLVKCVMVNLHPKTVASDPRFWGEFRGFRCTFAVVVVVIVPVPVGAPSVPRPHPNLVRKRMHLLAETPVALNTQSPPVRSSSFRILNSFTKAKYYITSARIR
ncbi:hypothetical protein EDC01DRAFT_135319 [Geopyxis carbonaria]|nr:hypothetical protein EDC01DRAFT_135319 [Geopyxis carbonaria]